MRAKLILAVLFVALGIGLLLWSGKHSASDQPSSAPAQNTASKFEPAVRRMGHVLIVAGVVFVVLAIYPHLRKRRPPRDPPPPDPDGSHPFAN